MTVAACPSCQESVTVPVDATPDCVVRCPLCHEEFKLEAFLTQLPPSLIVLDPGSGIAQQPPANAGPEPDASSSNVLGAFAASSQVDEPGDSVPAFDFTPGSVADGDEEPTAIPARRQGRRQKNPTVEVIKIVAGAMLAIPAAQIILWLVPGDWKRDLLGIGPAVSRVVPWVVPEKFRAPEAASDDDQSTFPTPQHNPTTVERHQARPRVSNGSAMPKPGSGQQIPLPQEQPDADVEGGSMSGTTPASASDTVPASAANTTPAKQEANAAPAIQEPESPSAKVLVRGVRGAPQYSLADLRAAFETALQASIAWDTNLTQDEEQTAKLTQQFYEAFALLSEAVTYPPPQDPGTGDLVTQLSGALAMFAKEPKKLAMIGNQTAAWLDRPSRPNEGIFIFGTVKQIKMSGQVYETELELAALQKRSITVVSRVDPRNTFAAGDRILMLGAIVEEPDRNLLGYEGKEPMVVMGGFPVVLQ